MSVPALSSNEADFTMQWGLLRLAMAVKSSYVSAATDSGLTGLQAITLCMLRLDAPCTMSAIARLASCDPSNLSDAIDKLVRSGLVDRQESPSDRRHKLLVLTDQGQALRADLFSRAAQQSLPCHQNLSPADDQTFHRLILAACVAD